MQIQPCIRGFQDDILLPETLTYSGAPEYLEIEVGTKLYPRVANMGYSSIPHTLPKPTGLLVLGFSSVTITM
jgi:hypothetical protein